MAGCGSSNDIGMIGNPGASTNPTGSLTFDFVTVAQAEFEVPSGTTDVRFEMHEGVNGTGDILLSVTRPYAPSITISSVPVKTQSTVITFFDTTGVPVSQATVASAVVPGRDTTISATDAVVSTPLFQNITATIEEAGVAPSTYSQIVVVAHFDSGDSVILTGDARIHYAVNPPSSTGSVNDDGTLSGNLSGEVIDVSLTLNETLRTISVSVPYSLT